MRVSGGIFLKKTNILLFTSVLCLGCSGIYYANQPKIQISDTPRKQQEAKQEKKVEKEKEITALFQLEKTETPQKRTITSISMKAGFYDLNGSIYFFDELGIPHTGFITYQGNTYYLIGKEGLAHGFQTIDDQIYYFDADGIMKTGLQTIEEKNYYFDEQGKLQTGFISIEDKIRYFTSSGEKTGFITIGTDTFYVDSNRGRLTSFQIIQNHEYYFNNNGVMQIGFQNIDQKDYYFDESGKRKTGWIEKEDGTYYLSDTTLAKGFTTIDDQTYYFDTEGKRQSGFQTIDQNTYYFKEDGTMTKGSLILDDKHYYFNQEGISQIGLIKENDRTYYITEDHLLKTGFQEIDGKTYYFDDSGNMMTGFQTINNQTYYFHTDGVMATGELQLIDKKYTFNDQGVLIKEEELGKTFFHSDGSILATNAKKVIDVSKFQGDIDWEAVKNSDVDGAILRLGFGSYSLDSKFVQNLNEVKRLGIPYGIYLYSYAVDSAGAMSEADFVLSMLNQYQIEPDLGVYYDIESNDITSYLTIMHYEEIIPTFLQKVRTSGYKTQVYTYKSLANEKLYSDKLKKEITWIAQYNDRCTWDGYYEGWQYTSSGNVPGIYGNVDISIFGNFVR